MTSPPRPPVQKRKKAVAAALTATDRKLLSSLFSGSKLDLDALMDRKTSKRREYRLDDEPTSPVEMDTTTPQPSNQPTAPQLPPLSPTSTAAVPLSMTEIRELWKEAHREAAAGRRMVAERLYTAALAQNPSPLHYLWRAANRLAAGDLDGMRDDEASAWTTFAAAQADAAEPPLPSRREHSMQLDASIDDQAAVHAAQVDKLFALSHGEPHFDARRSAIQSPPYSATQPDLDGDNDDLTMPDLERVSSELQRRAWEREEKVAPAAPSSASVSVDGDENLAMPVPPLAATTPALPRFDYCQDDEELTISVYTKGLSLDQVRVCAVDPTALYVSVAAAELKWQPLFAAFDTKHTPKVEVTPYKVNVTLRKAIRGQFWSRLDRPMSLATSTVSADVAVRANIVATDGADAKRAATEYPTSRVASRGTDWDSLNRTQAKEEEDEPVTGDAGLQKLFQRIYGDGDDDTKRAMARSYSTSGGTVLSTSWKDVKDRDYEKEMREKAEGKTTTQDVVKSPVAARD